MSAREAQRLDQEAASASMLDPKVRGLLDHIAAELAEEYIRLMELAAEAEGCALEVDRDSIGGDER